MIDRNIRPSRQRKGADRSRATPKGRRINALALAQVRELLGGAPRRRDLLIEHMHRMQDAWGCLTTAHLAALAAEMGLSLAEVYEVATFYHHFDVIRNGEAPPPSLTVRVCDTLSCRLAGAEVLLRALPAILGAEVRVLRTPCVGRCEQAPVAVVGHNPVAPATPIRVAAVAAEGAADAPMPSYVNYDAYRSAGGYRTWLEVWHGRRPVEEVIDSVDNAGLRGLGGAGFLVGRKWRIVRAEREPRLMVVNIDEGEPGTFKDRWYLERDPHRVLEGMLIAAYCVGAAEVFIYLRDEYAQCRAILTREIAALQANAPTPLPPIYLRRGAGAYICGEESAMIESIEGRRGVPRLRPPYVAQVGLFGRPTLAHNMETLLWLREILERGPQWFAGHGRRGRHGLRSVSVSGRVNKPGVHVVPAGISARELIEEFAGGMQLGHRFYAYLPGGASGGILPAALGDLPLDFDTLNAYGCFIGSAALIVLSQQDRARDAALNLVRFFASESCGQCTPCRVGTDKAVRLMQAPRWDRALLDELCRVMADASICGLGQAAPNPIQCVLKHFAHEFD